MELTHWKKLQNPDYIGSYAFQPDEEKIVKIGDVREETVTGSDGKKERCTVIHFSDPAGTKPMILNVTNAKIIEKLAGSPYIEQWKGLSIQLYVTKVAAFGEKVDAVRVRKTKPNPAKMSQGQITCADCGNPITSAYGIDPAGIAARTKATYGIELCAACAQKRKEASKERENLTQNEND